MKNSSMIFREAIEKRQAEEIATIRANAIEKAKKVAAMLKERYGAKRVTLFGSIVTKEFISKTTLAVIPACLESFLKKDAGQASMTEQLKVCDLTYGLISKSDYLHERSDIDLFVEGIKSEDFLKAGADAWRVTDPFDVDIIPAGIAHKNILKKALKEGIEL